MAYTPKWHFKGKHVDPGVHCFETNPDVVVEITISGMWVSTCDVSVPFCFSHQDRLDLTDQNWEWDVVGSHHFKRQINCNWTVFDSKSLNYHELIVSPSLSPLLKSTAVISASRKSDKGRPTSLASWDMVAVCPLVIDHRLLLKVNHLIPLNSLIDLLNWHGDFAWFC